MSHLTSINTAKDVVLAHDEIAPFILSFLPDKDQCTARLVCKKWKEMIDKENPVADRLSDDNEDLIFQNVIPLSRSASNDYYDAHFNEIFGNFEDEPS